jgi:hypothetical protein
MRRDLSAKVVGQERCEAGSVGVFQGLGQRRKADPSQH